MSLSLETMRRGRHTSLYRVLNNHFLPHPHYIALIFSCFMTKIIHQQVSITFIVGCKDTNYFSINLHFLRKVIYLSRIGEFEYFLF